MHRLIILFLFLQFSNSLNNLSFAHIPSFVISTPKVKTYFPTYVGNGQFSISSSQLGTIPTESYMINYYDESKNDVPRIANLPAWNEINFFNGVEWLNDVDIHSNEIKNYSQTLDMFNGVLKTTYSWEITNDNSEYRNTDIDIETFVSRKNKNLAVIKFEFTTNFSDEIKISFPINERKKPERVELAVLEKVKSSEPGEWPAFWYPGFSEVLKINGAKNKLGGQLSALSQSEGRNTNVALASEVFYKDFELNPDVSISTTIKKSSVNFNFRAQKSKTYTFYKLVSVVPEFDCDTDLVTEAINAVQQAKQKGFNNLLSEHKIEWSNLWDTDIVIEGNDELQLIIRSMIFYILCSADKNTQFSIPPMGLATSGYFGHIFWDSDIYMLPPLLVMYPEIAKSIVMFRNQTLKHSIDNAKMNNYKGAMYPWESDEIGKETTPFFAYQNALKENHIVGDVAFAQWQYFSAINDTSWLRNYGFDVIRETADFWTSRVNYNKEKDRYEIDKLISVSESQQDVSNETYTNTIAKINLEIAIKASDLLGIKSNPQWKEISEKILIPFNKEEEYHPLFEGAKVEDGKTEFWSSVVNLLGYPLQVTMSENTKRNDLIHAVNSLEKNGAGAMMGINFLSIIAAELGNDSLLNLTIDKTLKGYLKPPFNVLSETHQNKSVNFLTGAGSFLQQIIFGYTGLRITDAGIVKKYPPMLPKQIKKLVLQNFTLNNKKYDIIIENGKIDMVLRNN